MAKTMYLKNSMSYSNFRRFTPNMKDTKMDLTGFDDNTTTKKNGCNKSITLKVNPKGNEMVATDGYIETCEVLKSKIQKNA